MKKSILIILFLVDSIIYYSQISEGNIIGKYVGFDNCEISSTTLTIYNQNKFETNYTGHYFTNKVEKGKWKINGDTLITKVKREKELSKYIILGKGLCEFKDDTSPCKKFCLKKVSPTKNEKEIYDDNCTSLKEIGIVMFEDLKFTDEEFTTYVAASFNKNFPKTAVELNIVINSEAKACCRRMVIFDSTKMNDKQIEALKNTVLKYPSYDRIKFAPDEKLKYLTILISGDKKRKTTAYLLGGFLAGQ